MEIIVSNQIDEVQINVQHQKFVQGRKKADLTICLALFGVGSVQGGFDGRRQRSCKCNYVDFFKEARPPC